MTEADCSVLLPKCIRYSGLEVLVPAQILLLGFLCLGALSIFSICPKAQKSINICELNPKVAVSDQI